MVDPQATADAMYANDTASQALGITISAVAPGRATASMIVTPTMTNGHDVCHGGLIFTLADTAMAFASNAHNQVALAAGASVEFLHPAKEGALLEATATEQSLRGRSGIYDVAVTDQDNITIALFRGRTRQIGGVIVEDPS